MPIIRNNEESPIYMARSYFKNGKRYDFDEARVVFDCAHCELIRDFATKEAATTCLDLHYFHHHTEAHVPLVDNGTKEKIERWFTDLRLRGYSAVGQIKPAAKTKVKVAS
jgi:hypothetical protein